MRKLLSANFSRLWKSKVLWILVLGIIAFCAYSAYQGIGYVQRSSNPVLERFYFGFVPVTGMLFGLFIRLFTNPDYQEGTLRNKLIVGHSRRDIFLSNFIVNLAGSFVILAAFLLFGLLESLTIGPFKMEPKWLTYYYLIAFGTVLVFVAVDTWITSVSTNAGMTALYVGLVWVALIMAASGLYDRLSEPEMISGFQLLNGELVQAPPEPNPMYLSGRTRDICQFVLDVLPTGQGILMAEVTIEHPVRELISSLVLTGAALAGGILHFSRKDLK